MDPLRSSIFGIALLLAGVSSSFAGEFSSIDEAIALVQDADSNDWKREQEAEEYLLKNRKDSLPVLMRIVKNKEDGWFSCAYTLVKSENPDVVPLYIRLVRDNFFLKEADGRRMEFGFASKNGCELNTNQYGSVLASLLGSIGDERAIPVLKEAVKQGDSEVRGSAYEALYRLGEISFDKFFEIAKSTADPSTRMPEIVMGIIHRKMSTNPEQAVELYDRVINEFPDSCYEVACAHYWKTGCYRDLKNFDQALEQCDVVLGAVEYENLTEQIPGMRAEILKLAQQGPAGKPATPGESK